MTTPVPLEAGCYVRVSKKEQNPEHQRAEMERLCIARGWRPRWYVEKMRGTRNDRPLFAQLVSDALTGRIRAVVFWALDRMSRDHVFMLTQFQALEQAGVSVVSLAEKWTESDDDQKPLLLGVTAGMAASELKRLSRRSKAAHATARAAGKHVGRPLKSARLLEEAKRLVVGEGLSIRAAARQVSRGLPKRPEQPGGLCQISEGTLRKYLKGTWKGLPRGPQRTSAPSGALAPTPGGDSSPQP